MRSLEILLLSLVSMESLAYGPTAISRRSLIKAVTASTLVAPSIVVAEDVDIEDEQEILESINTIQDRDEPFSEFYFFRKRGSQWLKRRVEREKLSQRELEAKDKVNEENPFLEANNNAVDVASQH